MDMESSKLLKQAQQGDAEAFAALFESLRPGVFAIASRWVPFHEAEDVVMETYLKAWRSLPRFRGGSSLKTWLFRIAYNCSMDYMRTRYRNQAHVVLEGDRGGDEDRPLPEAPDDRVVLPVDQMAAEERAVDVRRALAQIPEEHRVTLMLRFADGLSYAEIAAATGVSIGTVMSRLFYGKRRMKQCLAGEGKEASHDLMA
jgi:RNA polymerase sigma-70 factor (ECF subfamily)